jgi:hypothetical protein
MKDLKCSRHPKYKALRKPTADCAKCRAMYAAKQNKDFFVIPSKWKP